MNTITSWFDTTVIALQGLWKSFIHFLPNLIGAIIVLLIGWLISMAIGQLITEVLKRLKFNKLFEKGSWKNALQKADIDVDASAFIGAIFKWILLIVFLIAAVQILGFNQLSQFFNNVLNYLPNVIVAAFIFVVAAIIADILEKVVRASVESFRSGFGPMIGAIIRWSIWIFAVFAILTQLGIATSLVNTIMQGIVALIVIAGGIAFGLGGKDVAGEIVRDLRDKFRK